MEHASDHEMPEDARRKRRRRRQKERVKQQKTIRTLVLNGQWEEAAGIAAASLAIVTNQRHTAEVITLLMEACVYEHSLREDALRPLLIRLITQGRVTVQEAEEYDRQVECRIVAGGLNNDPEVKIVHFVRSAAMRAIINGEISSITGRGITDVRVLKNVDIPGPDLPTPKQSRK